ncbi:MAG TPA: 6-bladed beta-propeller [Bacteroidales bacterium]|nr:6-bladed beta-propeller [Bacteroidales bacterium]
MKKSIPLAIMIIALVLVNCSGKKAHPDIKSEVNDKIASQALHFPKSGEDTLKTSYFADTVIYIPLETTKESFIRSIYQLWMNDSVILINNWGGGLLMFKQNGKFKRQIGKKGRGPGEYGNIYHFDVIRDTIYISSTVRRGFLRYTFDGTFCDEIKLNYEPAYFSSTDDQKLACFVHGAGKIYVYNKTLHAPPDTITVEYGVTIGRYRYMVYLSEGYNYLQKTQTGLLFNSFLSDTVWNITGEKKEPAFILNMKDKLLPYDKQIEFSKGDFEWYQKMANPYSFVHLIPFPSMTFIFQFHHTINASDAGYEAIYLNTTKTGEIKKFKTSYIYDDLVSKQKLSNERLTYFYPIYPEDYLVTTKKPLDVLKYLDQNKENSKEVPSLSWLNQMKTIKEDDNPILVKIKIKKNLQ